MTGDFDKCKVGDLILYKNTHPSDSWQNGVVMILNKKENGWVDCIKMSLPILEKFHEDIFVSSFCINIVSDNCTLITHKDLINKFRKTYKI